MVGILLVHGFAGTREEIKPLYDFLCDKGYDVSVPLLAGHEGTLKELSMSKYKHWIDSVEEEYVKLSEKRESIIVIGFSMGGLVAVNLYQKYKFDGLITINTPVYYWDVKRILKNLYSDFSAYSKKYFQSSSNKPIPALLEFQKLLSKTKPLFKNIGCNALVIQTQDDDTVNPKSAEYIFAHLNGIKQILKPKSGGHIVFQSNDYSQLLDSINEFVEKF